MGFRNSAYATVWSVEPGKGNFTKVRINCSRKNKDTGNYEQDFSGFCMFIGTAHAKASRLKERDRIKLLEVDVTTTYDKESRREYVNYKVFDFDVEPSYSGGGQNAQQAGEPLQPEVDTDDLPF